MTDDDSNKSPANVQAVEILPPKQMDEEEIQADIKKHLNVDFGDEEVRRSMRLGSLDDMGGLGLGRELAQFHDNN